MASLELISVMAGQVKVRDTGRSGRLGMRAGAVPTWHWGCATPQRAEEIAR